MKNRVKTIAMMGLCTAVALILAYVEAMLPPLFSAVPGVKMGLPNIIIIFILYRRGFWSAALVSLLRMILVVLLFGNGVSFLYSLAGGVLSLLVMALLQRTKLFSAVGVSVAGGVLHNAGQILMAMLLLETAELGYYMVVLTVTGVIAGVLIGLCGWVLIRRIPSGSVF